MLKLVRLGFHKTQIGGSKSKCYDFAHKGFRQGHPELLVSFQKAAGWLGAVKFEQLLAPAVSSFACESPNLRSPTLDYHNSVERPASFKEIQQEVLGTMIESEILDSNIIHQGPLEYIGGIPLNPKPLLEPQHPGHINTIYQENIDTESGKQVIPSLIQQLSRELDNFHQQIYENMHSRPMYDYYYNFNNHS